MADTQKNRLAGGPKIYMALAESSPGTPIPIPALTGTSITWGTDWAQLPSASNDPALDVNFKAEPFTPTQYLHPTDSDLVEIGTNSVSWEMKETDVDALMLGIGSALKGSVAAGTGTAGYDYMLQPLSGTDFPLSQIMFQYNGPEGGWGQLVWFPRVRRGKIEPVAPKKGSVRTLKLTFEVFAVEDSDLIPEGTCSKMFEYTTAPLS